MGLEYAKEKLHLAALKLRGRGGPTTRLRKANSDLAAVFESDIPAERRAEFREVREAICEGRGDPFILATKLDSIAASMG